MTAPPDDAMTGNAGWRPIESAPRDGTEILVFAPEDRPQIVVVKWCQFDEPFEGQEGCWQYVDETICDIAPEGPVATHWKPANPPVQP